MLKVCVCVWCGVIMGDVWVVIGVCFLLFLFFKEFGLIIVDEEYDVVFK